MISEHKCKDLYLDIKKTKPYYTQLFSQLKEISDRGNVMLEYGQGTMCHVTMDVKKKVLYHNNVKHTDSLAG